MKHWLIWSDEDACDNLPGNTEADARKSFHQQGLPGNIEFIEPWPMPTPWANDEQLCAPVTAGGYNV